MDALRWHQRPKLRHPVLITAFAGWNDAADSATGAVEYLGRVWEAKEFAEVDPEEFFDFTVARPQIRLTDDLARHVDWPSTSLAAASVPGGRRDVVLLHGTEPGLRWRSFCETVVGAASGLGIEMVVSLGALLADVPHTRPVRVTGTAADPELVGRLGLRQSRYEGPTGILGVLHEAFAGSGIPSASLWANVPHYVAQSPSPKATLALVRRTASLLGTRVETLDLEVATSAYERQVNELVAADEDAAAYVARLEEAGDDGGDDGEGDGGEEDRGPIAGDQLVDEVAQFLRDHHGD
ncbi:MAG: PAC2 family protein [Acidimicrobiales bacterium]